MNQTVTLIAKGPNAVHASRFIAAAPGTDIASVNDACALFTEPIDYLFFSDITFAQQVQGHADRIARFVSPVGPYEHPTPDWLKELEGERWSTYADKRCDGDASSLIACVLRGGIAHHHTTTGAMHWLAKIGKYQRIRIIGVDGGRCFAAGVYVSPTVQNHLHEKLGDDYLDLWKRVTHRLADILHQIYGTEFEWYRSEGEV